MCCLRGACLTSTRAVGAYRLSIDAAEFRSRRARVMAVLWQQVLRHDRGDMASGIAQHLDEQGGRDSRRDSVAGTGIPEPVS